MASVWRRVCSWELAFTLLDKLVDHVRKPFQELGISILFVFN